MNALTEMWTTDDPNYAARLRCDAYRAGLIPDAEMYPRDETGARLMYTVTVNGASRKTWDHPADALAHARSIPVCYEYQKNAVTVREYVRDTGGFSHHVREWSPVGRRIDERRMGPEVITAREALTRIKLGQLAPEGWAWANVLVDWTGYPEPLWGHAAVYGYGPMERPDQPDPERRGVGRLYQSVHQVSQHSCSGPVLFSFSRYQARGSIVVSIVELEDRGGTALRAGMTG